MTDSYVIAECPGNGMHGGTVRLLNGEPIGKGYGVRLPSGMTHWFPTYNEAVDSNYWPAFNSNLNAKGKVQ